MCKRLLTSWHCVRLCVLVLDLQLGGHQHLAHLHHGSGFNMPQWPPAGSMGRSPGMMMMLGSTPPMGRSVDMVDICTQLMEAGGEQSRTAAATLQDKQTPCCGAVVSHSYTKPQGSSVLLLPACLQLKRDGVLRLPRPLTESAMLCCAVCEQWTA